MQTSQESTNRSAHLFRLLEIEREFHVPVNELFAAFTTADALKEWWWPNGLYADRVEIDFREGGKYFINMKGFDQGGGGMTGEFLEIAENERIVMTDQFADAKGNPISAEQAGMTGTWPEKITITFEFEAIDKNTSGFKLFQEGIPEEALKDCIQGWSESFDKLRAYL